MPHNDVAALFAEGVSGFDPAAAGVWLLGFVSVAGIIVLVLIGLNQFRQITRRPRVPHGDRFVTREELARLELSMKEDGAATKRELQRIETDLKAQLTSNEQYGRRRVHELADSVQQLMTGQAAMPLRMREMLDSALQPLTGKVDGVTVAVAALGERLRPAAAAEEGK